MKRFFQIFIILFLSACSEKKEKYEENSDEKVDITLYKADGFNMHINLALASNNKFILETSAFSCFGGGEIKKISGTYSKDKKQVKLKPKNIEIEIYSEDSPMANPTTKKLKYGPDSLKIKTIFRIVRWDKNEYLLSKEKRSFFGFKEDYTDFERFAYYYNIGDEPKQSGWYLVNKKGNDSTSSSFDRNQIPEEYRKQFLKKPIVAKIIDIVNIPETEYEGEHWMITVNKGHIDGVNKNLIFKTENMEMFIEPDSIFKNTTIGKSYLYKFKKENYPIGTILKTKW